MLIWVPANIDKIRKERKLSDQGFLRAVTRAAPPYKLEPSYNHLRNIVTGKVKNPGVQYALLFADVLNCRVDDFVVDSCAKR